MSDLYPKCQLSHSTDCPPASIEPVRQILETRNATLGNDLTIRRALPHKQRRTIGAWCFLDHFGPLNLTGQNGMNIGPHPHIGLQTFTWLIEGSILHRDSIGNEQIINAGQVNLMTAGKGIAHSEESIYKENKILHGAQLWIALPDSARFCEPAFHHYEQLLQHEQDGIIFTLLTGEMFNQKAQGHVFSPIVGVDIVAKQATTTTIALEPTFEYGLLMLEGEVIVENKKLPIGKLLYLGTRRDEITLILPKDAHLLLIGGEPFKEEILIWWNFVARTKEEIKTATQQWQNFQHFGDVKGYRGDRLSAPDLPW